MKDLLYPSSAVIKNLKKLQLLKDCSRDTGESDYGKLESIQRRMGTAAY